MRLARSAVIQLAHYLDKPRPSGPGRALLLAMSFALLTAAAGCTSLPLPNFHQVSDSIYRGGRPSEEGIKELARMGVKTIVDLESGFFVKETDDVKREEGWARQSGIKFIKVPMHPFFAPDATEVGIAYDALSNKENQPVFVHCVRGSDRTGTVIASYRIFSEGWTFDKAFAEMKEYGHRNMILFWWRDVIKKIFTRDNARAGAAGPETE